jgi:hypothetical protein
MWGVKDICNEVAYLSVQYVSQGATDGFSGFSSCLASIEWACKMIDQQYYRYAQA